MRVVLDTNVLVSALVFRRGPLTWLRDSWVASQIVPLTSVETVAEFRQVLSYPKFGLTDAERQAVLDRYLPWCETVSIIKHLEVPECRDPGDRQFLELAMAGSADVIVTGDADLLALSPLFTVPIITPPELRNRLVRSG